MGRTARVINIKFEYEIVSPKYAEMATSDFDHCHSLDDVLDELREQCPNMEWSVHPDENQARKLWEMIQSQRAAES